MFVKMPSVLWYLMPHMTVDTALHAIALAGVILSASVLLLQFNSSVLFAALYLLYLSLFQYVPSPALRVHMPHSPDTERPTCGP
jgi:hypothetical protein